MSLIDDTKQIVLAIAGKGDCFRRGFSEIIRKDVVIACCVKSIEKLIEKATDLKCTALLLDFELVSREDKDAIAGIKERFPALRIFIVLRVVEQDQLERIKQMGVSGVLHIDSPHHELEEAFESKGKLFYAREILEHILITPQTQPADTTELSEREEEVFQLLIAGMEIKEIADQLNVTPDTIYTHKQNIFAKTKCSNVVQLLRWAVRNKRVRGEDL